jgi:hypothetical protein
VIRTSKTRQHIRGATHDSDEPAGRGPHRARRRTPEGRDGGAIQEHVSREKEGEGIPETRKMGGLGRLDPLDPDPALRERLGSPSRPTQDDEPDARESSLAEG